MKRNGFTLIELVVVIVILGILAVVAAPKFLNLQQDARDASLKGLEGAIKSTLGVTYAKLATLGLENAAYLVDDENVLTSDTKKIAVVADLSTLGCKKDGRCVFEYGYPSNYAPTLATLVDGISVVASSPDNDFVAVPIENDPQQSLAITFKNNVKEKTISGQQYTVLKNDNCYIRYSRSSIEPDHVPSVSLVPCK
ncbi:TPA: type II secretion system protein [Photobacterium damselae]|uniref:type II secretion system protein n=1 Tax=Photobacterium damselae TaxID=38293 RepID=UPI0022AA5D79|nr:type II secretion system protein [Photobacterium damselae]